MLYFILVWLQKTIFRLYLKHIHVTNLDAIPLNKPVVIACNHPGAFMDPGFIGNIIPKPIHFTTRGDVFANPIVRKILKGMHLNPVYRFDEGFGNLTKNFETIENLTDVLKNNGIVLIFSEGYGAVDRRLKPLRKGTARIFLQIAAEHNLDIQLYAAGLTYTHKINFRKSILCSFSEPLFLKDYLTDFITHRQRGYHTFSKELACRISDNFVVVENPECDAMVDLHINYQCNTEKLSIVPIVKHNRKKLTQLQTLSKAINLLFKQDPLAFQELEKRTNAYEEALIHNKISDCGLTATKLNFGEWILILLALPLSTLGFFFFGIPFLIAKKISDKKVTRIDFYDSVCMNSVMLIYSIIALTTNILLAFNIGWWSCLTFIIAPALGMITAWTYDALLRDREARRADKCLGKEKMLQLRKTVVEFM